VVNHLKCRRKTQGSDPPAASDDFCGPVVTGQSAKAMIGPNPRCEISSFPPIPIPVRMVFYFGGVEISRRADSRAGLRGERVDRCGPPGRRKEKKWFMVVRNSWPDGSECPATSYLPSVLRAESMCEVMLFVSVLFRCCSGREG
jgi:hypothetical protein